MSDNWLRKSEIKFAWPPNTIASIENPDSISPELEKVSESTPEAAVEVEEHKAESQSSSYDWEARKKAMKQDLDKGKLNVTEKA
jgi:hypothetical protein